MFPMEHSAHVGKYFRITEGESSNGRLTYAWEEKISIIVSIDGCPRLSCQNLTNSDSVVVCTV